MKIVLISRCSYPQQGPRAFRTAELSEQLAKEGHDVTLYIVASKYDYAQYTEDTGVKIKFIHTHFSTTNSDGTGRWNLVDRLFFRLLHRLIEYPDIEFMFKLPRILKQESDIDLLITIAQPHPIHWGTAIAKGILKSRFPKCWVADCGDPYVFNPITKPFKYFSCIEKFWCSRVDYISVPSQSSFSGYYPEFHEKLKVIPQGFDFSKTPITEYKKNDIPTFVYAGAIYDGVRDPYNFLKFLNTLKRPFRFIIYTNSDIELSKHCTCLDSISVVKGLTRKEIILELSKADFLINISNGNTVQTPSKLIDYYIAKRPVLQISTLFKEQNVFLQFLDADYSNQQVIANGEDFRIEKVARQFLHLIHL